MLFSTQSGEERSAADAGSPRPIQRPLTKTRLLARSLA